MKKLLAVFVVLLLSLPTFASDVKSGAQIGTEKRRAVRSPGPPQTPTKRRAVRHGDETFFSFLDFRLFGFDKK